MDRRKKMPAIRSRSEGGVEEGIEKWTHAMRLLWQQHFQKEGCGFLLIDTRNVFNEDNQTEMTWEVRHDWPSGAQFTLKCYLHWATLVIRNGAATGHFLYSKEGVTQEYTLVMTAYGIGVLSLIRELQEAHPKVSKPWYADDAGMVRTSPHILSHPDAIMVRGIHKGFIPEPTNIILVISDPNLAPAESFLRGKGITIVTNIRYLGGYIVGTGPQVQCMVEKVQDWWPGGIRTLEGVAHKLVHATYTGLQ